MSVDYTYAVPTATEKAEHDALVPRLPPRIVERLIPFMDTVGTKETPARDYVYDFAQPRPGRQFVSYRNSLVEVLSFAYYTRHDLGAFRDRFELGQGMRLRLTSLEQHPGLSGADILAFRLDPTNQQHIHSGSDSPARLLPPPATGSEHIGLGNVPLPRLLSVSRQPSPSPLPDFHDDLEAADVKALQFTLKSVQQWAEDEKLTSEHRPIVAESDASTASMQRTAKSLGVTGWKHRLSDELIAYPWAVPVLSKADVTTRARDVMLRKIVMAAFSPALRNDYFHEHGKKTLTTAVELYEWAVIRCTQLAEGRKFELERLVASSVWNGTPEAAYDFLCAWKGYVSELQEYDEAPWTPRKLYDNLRYALLSSSKSAMFMAHFKTLEHRLRRDAAELTQYDYDQLLLDCLSIAALQRRSTPSARPKSPPASLNVDDDAIAFYVDGEPVAYRALGDCWACKRPGHRWTNCPDSVKKAALWPA